MTTLPYSRPLTVADLDRMPDDGHRYELLDGTLIVTPAPSLRHQVVSANLHVLLTGACPVELRVLAAPFEVVLDAGTSVQPDLLVGRRSEFTDRHLPVAPLLAVEILSPSTRLIDLNLKRAAYERGGVASYWIVDPDDGRLLVHQLSAGTYVEVADVSGQETWTASAPFPVTVAPARLTD